MNIDQVIDAVIVAEGGYVNNVNDAGGETMYGITVATARANKYFGKMRDLPRALAVDIYRRQYVIAPGFDKVAAVSSRIAAELVDTGVNMGPTVPSRFLQRALNVLNNQGRDFADLLQDGNVGPGTVGALRAFVSKRGAEGEKRLLDLLNALQGEHYVTLAEGRSGNEAFMYGWLARVAS